MFDKLSEVDLDLFLTRSNAFMNIFKWGGGNPDIWTTVEVKVLILDIFNLLRNHKMS